MIYIENVSISKNVFDHCITSFKLTKTYKLYI